MQLTFVDWALTQGMEAVFVYTAFAATSEVHACEAEEVTAEPLHGIHEYSLAHFAYVGLGQVFVGMATSYPGMIEWV